MFLISKTYIIFHFKILIFYITKKYSNLKLNVFYLSFSILLTYVVPKKSKLISFIKEKLLFTVRKETKILKSQRGSNHENETITQNFLNANKCWQIIYCVLKYGKIFELSKTYKHNQFTEIFYVFGILFWIIPRERKKKLNQNLCVINLFYRKFGSSIFLYFLHIRFF